MAYGIASIRKRKNGNYRVITWDKNLNGSYTIKDGLNKMTYYGYSKNESIARFKREFN